MKYRELAEFIDKRMRMSHVYQPVMLMTLLRSKGRCTEERVAKALLAQDVAQVDYYKHITRDMVGRVLRSHGIVERDRKAGTWELRDWSHLKPGQVVQLVEMCKEKLANYLEKRGDRPWEHRKRGHRYISGTLQYEVLKRAKFRCELCGISASEKRLEVDHIVPRNHGGPDTLDNLQALCYSCNATKRDRDDTDFRGVATSYQDRETECVFCDLQESDMERVVAENPLAMLIRDGFPVTDGHSLVIPKRHVASYFDLYQPELNACRRLLGEAREQLIARDSTITGCNVGINDGESAGQTVFHCHIHLIPRRNGDVGNPKGGVRRVFAKRADYTMV